MHSTIDLLREHAARSSRGTALHADGRALSYGDLDGMSNRIGHALAVTAGARVAFLGKNSAHYFAVLAACGKVGAVIVPLNWRLAYPELTAIVADADAAVIVVDDEFAEVARRLEADPEVTLVVRTIDTRTGTGNWYDTFPATDPGYRPHRDDVAIQMYTSGTTGQPKGVMSTHGAVLDSLRILAGVAGIGRDAVSLCTLPTFHIGGTSWTLTGLWAGCTTVLLREVELLSGRYGWRRPRALPTDRGTPRASRIPRPGRIPGSPPQQCRRASARQARTRRISSWGTPTGFHRPQAGNDTFGATSRLSNSIE
ncbi:hypothetical protein FRAAL2517 [Frankia alni ACN14a]|uniref:AMP-dependent synthetase/ligase domain-containing protein n=1 Tax=Frankia alni (strain DSM 45986 / CECT 9034 / ACN14a) TaxID=326424 RepID=Q0RMT3_FRAAA|nr:hypothetical protein FRAAL2517 [Frankia alni ACN14a]